MIVVVFLLAVVGMLIGSTPTAANQPTDGQPFRFVVKSGSPKDMWYPGTVESGTLRPGDVVYIDPSGRKVFGYVEAVSVRMCPVPKATAGPQYVLKIRGVAPPREGDVLVRVDEFYDDPAPPPPEEAPPVFELRVEDNFQLTGVGTVVVGTVDRGAVGVSDQVTIESPDGSRRQTIVIMILKDRQKIDRAEVGDMVGIALRGIDRDLVGRCSRVIKTVASD